MHFFVSDNTSPASPSILKAISEANRGYASAYGHDEWSLALNEKYSEFFEKEVFVYVAPTGTAANALAIASISESFGEVLCHADSHVLVSEGGAIEFFSGGCRLMPMQGEAGLIDLGQFAAYVTSPSRRALHQRALSALSISFPTERGALYKPDTLREFSRIAHEHGMRVHMDGSRLSNALVAMNSSPADLTWRCGVDVLSFGATKNGTLNAEAVIAFDAETSRKLRFLQKRGGYLTSKMRYQAAQLLAFIEDDVWRVNAQSANSFARRLADAFATQRDSKLSLQPETNQLFVNLSDDLILYLKSLGIEFARWRTGGYRLVASYCDEEYVQAVEKALSVRIA